MDSTVLCLLSKGGKTWIMKNCMELVVSTKVAAVGANHPLPLRKRGRA